jgi:hypothetical protein
MIEVFIFVVGAISGAVAVFLLEVHDVPDDDLPDDLPGVH